jgi:hypothetical protein
MAAALRNIFYDAFLVAILIHHIQQIKCFHAF